MVISAYERAPDAGEPGASSVAIGTGTGGGPAIEPAASLGMTGSRSLLVQAQGVEGTPFSTITVAAVFRRDANNRAKGPLWLCGMPVDKVKEEVSGAGDGTRSTPVSDPLSRKGVGGP